MDNKPRQFHHCAIFYADDTVIFTEAKNPEEAASTALSHFQTWLNKSYLILNATVCLSNLLLLCFLNLGCSWAQKRWKFLRTWVWLYSSLSFKKHQHDIKKSIFIILSKLEDLYQMQLPCFCMQWFCNAMQWTMSAPATHTQTTTNKFLSGLQNTVTHFFSDIGLRQTWLW